MARWRNKNGDISMPNLGAISVPYFSLIKEEYRIYMNELVDLKRFFSEKEDLNSEEEDEQERVSSELIRLKKNLRLMSFSSITIEFYKWMLDDLSTSEVMRRSYKFFLKILEFSPYFFENVTLRGDGISSNEIIKYIKGNLKIKTLIIDNNAHLGIFDNIFVKINFYDALNSALNLFALEFRLLDSSVFLENYPDYISAQLLELSEERSFLIDCVLFHTPNWEYIFHHKQVKGIKFYTTYEEFESNKNFCLNEKERVTFIKSRESIQIHYDCHKPKKISILPRSSLEKVLQSLFSGSFVNEGERKFHQICQEIEEHVSSAVPSSVYDKILDIFLKREEEIKKVLFGVKQDIILCIEIDRKENFVVHLQKEKDTHTKSRKFSLIKEDIIFTEGNQAIISRQARSIHFARIKQYTYILAIDKSSYIDTRITALLENCVNAYRSELIYLDPILGGYEWGTGNHQTLLANIMIPTNDVNLSKQKMIIPIRLAPGDWVLIYVIYSESISSLKRIHYFDPKMRGILPELEKVILKKETFRQCQILVQDDEYDDVIRNAKAIVSGEIEQSIDSVKNELLSEAVSDSDLLATQILCLNGIDLKSRNSAGRTVIDIAAENSKDVNILRLLLSVPLPLPQDNIVLSTNAYNAAIEKWKNFLAEEHDPLLLACHGQKIDNIIFLIKCGVEIDKRLIDVAFKLHNYDIMEFLLKEGSLFPDDFESFSDDRFSVIIKERNILQKMIETESAHNVMHAYKTGKLTKKYVSKENHTAPFIAFFKGQYETYALLRAHGFLPFKDEMQNISVEIDHLNVSEQKKMKFFMQESMHSYHFSMIDFFLSRTKILQNDRNLFNYVSRCYAQLAEIPEVLVVMKVLEQADFHFRISFDFERDNVQEISPTDTPNAKGSCNFLVGQISIGGDVQQPELLGTLAHELTHQAMQIVYRNNCAPYNDKDSKNKETIENISNRIKHLTQNRLFLMTDLEDISCSEEDKRSFKLKITDDTDDMAWLDFLSNKTSLGEDKQPPNLERINDDITCSEEDKSSSEQEITKIYISSDGSYIVYSPLFKEIKKGKLPEECKVKVRRLTKEKLADKDFNKFIVDITRRDTGLVCVNDIIDRVYKSSNYNESDRTAELIVRINHMLAQGVENRSSIQDSPLLSPLYDFYMSECVSRFEDYLKKYNAKVLLTSDLSAVDSCLAEPDLSTQSLSEEHIPLTPPKVTPVAKGRMDNTGKNVKACQFFPQTKDSHEDTGLSGAGCGSSANSGLSRNWPK